MAENRPGAPASPAAEEVAAVWVPIDSLKPWDRNPQLNDHAVDKVAESIKRFGFAAPILARKADAEVIAGHTRLKAARKLGLERVPVRFLDLDPADAPLLNLADNRLSQIATFDEEGLKAVLRELQAEDLDLEIAGFDPEELEGLLEDEAGGTEGETDPDAVPEPSSPVGAVPRMTVCGPAGRRAGWGGEQRSGRRASAKGYGRAEFLAQAGPSGAL